MNTPVTETRTYEVTCSRRISEDCARRKSLHSYDPDQPPRSITAAEDHLRKDGWILHSDGRASCGPCVDRWENPAPADDPA